MNNTKKMRFKRYIKEGDNIVARKMFIISNSSTSKVPCLTFDNYKYSTRSVMKTKQQINSEIKLATKLVLKELEL